MPIRDAIVIPGMIRSVNIVGRPGMMMLQMWVEETLLPYGKLMVIGWLAQHRFLIGTPLMMKIEQVAPVSMMACVVPIAIASAHSKCCISVEQFDVMTVALLSLNDNSAANRSKRLYSMGYNEFFWHKFLNLLSTFTAFHSQVDG
jgi:hypothetical protein